jgi:hypothetical protein
MCHGDHAGVSAPFSFPAGSSALATASSTRSSQMNSTWLRTSSGISSKSNGGAIFRQCQNFNLQVIDNVRTGAHFGAMRDDRYNGTSLPKLVRKLADMTEREADRAHPERLCQHAITALMSDAGREISPEFRRSLRQHDITPCLFGPTELAATARTGLEEQIIQNINAGSNSLDAVHGALLRRSEGYAREQRCRLIVDRHPNASVASESFKTACNDGASIAAKLILDGLPAPRGANRVLASENLLAQRSSGDRQ